MSNSERKKTILRRVRTVLGRDRKGGTRKAAGIGREERIEGIPVGRPTPQARQTVENLSRQRPRKRRSWRDIFYGIG